MHSDGVCLRNNMLNLAALLFIQLLFMWKGSADVVTTDYRNITVFRGEPVTLNCSTAVTNISQINWKKDNLFFAYRASDKTNVSDLTSDRLQVNIDSNSLSTLKLLNAQPDDAGQYICILTTKGGVRTTVWSLHVSEKPPEASPVRIPLYLLICVPVLLLCVIALTVYLCRKLRLSINPVQNQFEPGSTGEVVTTEPQVRTTRTEHRKRSQYKERLNSIYSL